jgi:3D (Asp-Asp-Asp) domain-containing protein
MKAILGRSAIIAAALLLGLIVVSPRASIAEPLLSQFQSEKEESKQSLGTTLGKFGSDKPTPDASADEQKSVVPASHYVATAYSLRGRTASGRMVTKGLIAADPRLLPLGSRVRLEAGGYSGEYLVADTGGAIRGRRIDIWTASSAEAMRFGRRTVKLTVLTYPAKRAKRSLKA